LSHRPIGVIHPYRTLSMHEELVHPMTRTFRPATILTALLAAAALFAAAFAAGPAGAIVPPKDCGKVKVGHKTYNIKADQLKCASARDYSVTYLKTHHKPRYYSCYSYSGSSIKFRCIATKYNPDRTFWAIKR
jgi:hypothetical protein